MNRLLAQYECVRVESMVGIDFMKFHFDFDLTFALLLMTPDGSVRHTFGGRDYTKAESHLSLASLTQTLRKTLVAHRANAWVPQERASTPRTVEDLASYQAKVKQKGVPKCVHCHEVHDFLREDALAQKRWTRADAWRWPDPRQVGLTLDRDNQVRVASIAKNSPAAQAGLRVDDLLRSVHGVDVLTFGDVQRALHIAPAKLGVLPLAYVREGTTHQTTVRVPGDWKAPTPLVFSWRASKWAMTPKPGFGGKALRDAEKAALGIASEAFAYRVTYLVTWGPHAATGRNAVKAGLRKGDVIVSLDGKSDFHSEAHVHAWFRLTRTPGATVSIETIRKGQRRTVALLVVK